MINVRRILVVSRMTPYCREAIRTGVAFARSLDAKLYVLHLESNPIDIKAVNAPGLFLKEQYKNYKNTQQEAKEELDKIVKQETKGGFPITELISDKEPAEEIVRVAREEKIDLMIMYAHEEGRLEHVLFGREQDKIIRRMPCSILLVKKEPEAVKW